MKVLIVGAGGQGGPCASILSRDKNVDEIRLVDLDGLIAERVASKIGSSKVKPGTVNATVVEDVAAAAKGVDVIIDFVMPWMASYVMKGALKAGANYVNSAFDTPFWEELADGKTLSLNKEFNEAGLTALLGCGMAPGFVNVMARLYCDKLDIIDSVKIRLGKRKTGGGEYDDYIKPWSPGWAPIQALKDSNDNAICFSDGQQNYVPPFDGIEEWQFPEPVGKLLVSHHSHEEPYSVPSSIGKGIKYCDFKYFLHSQPAALVALGLASDKEVDVKGIKVKPIDLVAAILPKPGNAFIDEDPSKFAYNDAHNFVAMDVEVKGKKDDKERSYLIHLSNMNVPGKPIYDLFGTSLVNVALPAVTGAKQILEGGYKGVIFAEKLNPQRFLDLMMETGYPYKWDVETK
ncbi:MAG: saccharopine dehydrogenase NADP-binding domain-containing protein [Eubacteriales bacterium]|nr:saccharopine dehydrogenase NADP-binding domain-containing protein [Eubacteriales bacterium]